jgi:hypothetical protein
MVHGQQANGRLISHRMRSFWHLRVLATLLLGCAPLLHADAQTAPGAGQTPSSPNAPAQPDKNGAAQPGANNAPPDTSPPALNPGRPTVTDPAALTAPGWIEAEFGIQKDLDRDRNLGTPLLLKLTARNARVEYRLENDGYTRLGNGSDGIGDTNFAIQYLFLTQAKNAYDVSGRFNLKVPTADAAIGTRKFDYSLLALASRDFSPTLHGDFNLGLASLTRQGAPGTDTQFLATASFTFPIKGGRWTYANELVYFSPILGQRAQVTTMHALSYAVHRYLVLDAAIQWELHGDGPVFQALAGATFFLGKVF